MFTADVARLEIHHSPKQPRGSKPLGLSQVIPQFYRAYVAIPRSLRNSLIPSTAQKAVREFRGLLGIPTSQSSLQSENHQNK